jgi:hypothetical protein
MINHRNSYTDNVSKMLDATRELPVCNMDVSSLIVSGLIPSKQVYLIRTKSNLEFKKVRYQPEFLSSVSVKERS